MESAVILIQCPDKKGIVASISNFLFKHDANIIQADQHSTGQENGRFFLRIEFCFEKKVLSRDVLFKDFSKLAGQLDAVYSIFFKTDVMRVSILVSKYDHCLADILYRSISGDLGMSIASVISNHKKVGPMVEQYGLPFYYLPVTKETKGEQEKQILEIVSGSTDFLILARYMQIISGEFIKEYKKNIINIHHSFLPSFKGASPYRRAYERGVKVIGATAHYVTESLDEGPIIEQIVEHVSHRDDVTSLMRKGSNLENLALSNAVRAELEHRIIRFQNRTIVFS